MTMLSCEEVLEEISNYIDDDLAPDLRKQIEEHLRMCRNCTVLVNTTRRTLTIVADNFVSELPYGVTERLFARLGLQNA
jgi:anti-sigma factor RsiW